MPTGEYRIGVDVGGTNTDAVLLDLSGKVVAKAKVPTTLDVEGGISAALESVLVASGLDADRVSHLMLGTTHATNAVLERRQLGRVAVVRIGAPATRAVRPLFGWPEPLRAALSAGEVIVGGGMELDGRELAPFDVEALRRFLASCASRLDAVAVTSVFAPVCADHELVAEEQVRAELGDCPVSLSHRVGSMGLLERENATVLNAALQGVAERVVDGLQRALHTLGLDPVPYFAQNDGTLMSLDYARRFPILTIGSGPANSIRGAALLAGVADAIVVDVGGTSTDIGVVARGFPRESSQGVEIGGVRTNFRMPDLITLALGGGSLVVSEDGRLRVGPESVGFALPEKGLVFGGQTFTLTDAGVARGRMHLGSERLPAWCAGPAGEALARVDAEVTAAIDRMKLRRGDRPVVAVGGGSELLPDEIPGATEVLRPPHFDVANAVGAATGAVSGQVDRVYRFPSGGREQALEAAKEEAGRQAVLAGADPGGLSVVELEEIPLAYLPGGAVRLRVKVVGPLPDGASTSVPSGSCREGERSR